MDRIQSMSPVPIRRIERALRGLYSLTDREGFPVVLTRTIAELVDRDLTSFTEIEVPTNTIRTHTDPSSEEHDALLPAFSEFWQDHPRLQHHAETGEGQAMAISDFISGADWHERGLYREMFRHLGIEDQASIMVPAHEDYVVGLVVNRSRRGFSRAEMETLDILRPHVARAWQNARAVSWMAGRDPDCGGRRADVLGITLRGQVTLGGRRSLALLRRFLGAGDLVGEVPAALVAWIHERLQAGPCGEPSLDLTERGDRLVLRLLPRDPGEPMLLLMSFDPLRDRVRAGLPARLERVLRELLGGASEKEAACGLGLSQHTVHEYVKQLYRRFGVSGRSELMALWIDQDR